MIEDGAGSGSYYYKAKLTKGTRYYFARSGGDALDMLNEEVDAEFTEVTGSLDASALDKDVRRHKMLLNLFLQKGSGPVAVESVEWKVLSVNQEEK